MTSTLTRSLIESAKFENNRKLIEKASRLLELSRRAERTFLRKIEFDEDDVDPERTKQQALVAKGQSERAWKYYKVVIKQLHHQ